MEVSSNVAAAAGPYADVVAIVLLLHAVRLLVLSHMTTALNMTSTIVMPPPHRVEALSDYARLTFVRLTSVCLSRTSGLSREQRGLGRLKLAQM